MKSLTRLAPMLLLPIHALAQGDPHPCDGQYLWDPAHAIFSCGEKSEHLCLEYVDKIYAGPHSDYVSLTHGFILQLNGKTGEPLRIMPIQSGHVPEEPGKHRLRDVAARWRMMTKDDQCRPDWQQCHYFRSWADPGWAAQRRKALQEAEANIRKEMDAIPDRDRRSPKRTSDGRRPYEGPSTRYEILERESRMISAEQLWLGNRSNLIKPLDLWKYDPDPKAVSDSPFNGPYKAFSAPDKNRLINHIKRKFELARQIALAQEEGKDTAKLEAQLEKVSDILAAPTKPVTEGKESAGSVGLILRLHEDMLEKCFAPK